MTIPILARLLLGILIFWMSFVAGPSKWGSRIAACAVATLAVLSARAIASSPPTGHGDLLLFWRAGQDLLHGRSPYSGPILSSPNSLPLFAAFALVPLTTLGLFWKWFNILGAALLVPLSYILVGGSQSPFPRHSLTTIQIAGLSGLVVLSNASVGNAGGGQLHVWTALTLLLGLVARMRGFQVLAGVAIALACVKVHTAAVFLLVLTWKRDGRTWVSFVLAIATLTLATTAPPILLDRVGEMLSNVKALSAPGAGNDYSYGAPASSTILGFNHALYRIGLRDRSIIGEIHLALNFILVTWTVWRVRSGRMPQSAQYSLLALVGVAFLYHRLYDAILLALPLTYSAVRYRSSSPQARWLYGVVGSTISALLFIPEYSLALLTKAQLPSLVQAVLLPLPFWLLLTAIAALDCAERIEERAPSQRLLQRAARSVSDSG